MASPAVTATELPPGFTLDPHPGEPPGGFTLDHPPERSAAEQAGRAVGFAGKGFNDSAAETLGALPEALVAAVRRLSGVSLAPEGYYSGAIKHGLDYLGMGGPQGEPQSTLERGAYGAGRGVGDAASVLAPAAVVARTTRVGGLAGRVAGAMAEQPVAQAVAGAAGGAVGEATGDPLAGVAASLAMPVGLSGLRRAISPVVNRLTPEQARLAAVATAEGIPLTAGQRTGSRPLQTMESAFEQMPLTSGPAAAGRRVQQDALNAATLRRAGINSNTATPDVIDAAHVRLGNEFERLSRNTTVQLDRPLLNDLWSTVSEYTRNLTAAQKPIFQRYVDDIITSVRQPGGMDGSTYQKTRSTLGRLAKSLGGTDPELSRAMDGLQSTLDDAAGRNISPALRDDWQTVRREYGNLRIIDRAMSIPSAGAAAGDISAAQIWGGVKAQRGEAGMARGRGELNDLARVGQAFIKPQIPNSGTPERGMMMKLLSGNLPLGGGIGAGVLSGGSPLAMGLGAAAGAASLGIPRGIQAALNSRVGQAWLTNQVGHGLGGPRTTPALLAAILAARAKDPAARDAMMSSPERLLGLGR